MKAQGVFRDQGEVPVSSVQSPRFSAPIFIADAPEADFAAVEANLPGRYPNVHLHIRAGAVFVVQMNAENSAPRAVTFGKDKLSIGVKEGRELS